MNIKLSTDHPVSTQLNPTQSSTNPSSFESECEVIDQKWSSAPRFETALDGFRKSGTQTLKEKIDECHKHKAFYKCPNCNRYFAVLMTCKSRLCPYCAKNRALKWFHRLKSIKMQYPLTMCLTSKHSQDLRGTINLVLKSFRTFRKSFPEMKKGVYSIEILPKIDGYWYVHIHMLFDCVWLDGDKVSKVWNNLTGAYVKDLKRRYGQGALLETCKYVTKGLENLTDEQRETVDESH